MNGIMSVLKFSVFLITLILLKDGQGASNQPVAEPGMKLNFWVMGCLYPFHFVQLK